MASLVSSFIHRTWIADAPLSCKAATFYSGVHRSQLGAFGAAESRIRCPEGMLRNPLNQGNQDWSKRAFPQQPQENGRNQPAAVRFRHATAVLRSTNRSQLVDLRFPRLRPLMGSCVLP